MEDLLIPLEVTIDKILENNINLSPSNYKKVDIKATNKIKLIDLLNTDNPIIRGNEPGSNLYLKNLKSNTKFIRNSCIDKISSSVNTDKGIYLNNKQVNFDDKLFLEDEDIVVATDANIGDSAIFIKDQKKEEYILSSGLVKLHVNKKVNKFYLLAMLRDTYFKKQLESLTPKGSTIRHSGNKLLDCYIPFPNKSDEWVIGFIEILMKNIIETENKSKNIQSIIKTLYDREFENINVNKSITNVSDLLKAKRVDAGFYSRDVSEFFEKIKNYKGGYNTLEELGYKTKRGPSLQKRDLGRSIKTTVYHPNYSLLIYPSDISEYGYIEKTTFIGASGKVWFLSKNDILFSAEGSVGKTFAICDESLKFITNIHGIIITPIKKEDVNINHTILICSFLNYMKMKGIIDKISVGGQGGSFAVQYWDILKFPKIENEKLEEIKRLYYNNVKVDPFIYNSSVINNLGIFELNKLRTFCLSILERIVSDIKLDTLKSEDFYKKLLSLD